MNLKNNDNINLNELSQLTQKHFTMVDLNIELTESESDSESVSYNGSSSDSGSSSGSGSDSGSGSGSGSGSSSEYETESDTNSDSKSNSNSKSSESSYLSESTEIYIDQDDLFNTKTNGNEFFGEVLNNRYLILKKLGYGSFSSVWMAYDINENLLVAIKIINPSDYKEGLLEIRTYKRLENLDTTYLLTMLNCFEVTPIHSKYFTPEYKNTHKKLRNHIVIILPLLACSTFDLLKCKEYENGLPLEIATKILEQTILGIKELEKHNLMHTDIKPENILTCGLNREAELLLKTIQDIDIKNVHRLQFEKIINKLSNSNKNNTDDEWLISYKIYKEITRTIIKFIKNDMQEIKKQMRNCKVSSKYLKNIQIKICDFNLVIDADENIDNILQIQTRYYRAPEIILGCGLDKKTDYWSIGCVFFELLTGDILFDPDKDKEFSRDVHHMYLIEELMGPMPKFMTNDSKIYNSNGFLINVGKRVKRWPLTEMIKENYDNLGLNDHKVNDVIDLIQLTLQLIPANRANLDTLLGRLKTTISK